MKIDVAKTTYSDEEIRKLPEFKKLRSNLEFIEEKEILQLLRKDIKTQRDKLIAAKKKREQVVIAAKKKREQVALNKKLHKEAERFVARLHKLGLKGHNWSIQDHLAPAGLRTYTVKPSK